MFKLLKSLFVSLLVVLFNRSLILKLRLAWNLLCSLNWPLTLQPPESRGHRGTSTPADSGFHKVKGYSDIQGPPPH